MWTVLGAESVTLCAIWPLFLLRCSDLERLRVRPASRKSMLLFIFCEKKRRIAK